MVSWDRTLHYRINSSPPFIPILSPMNPALTHNFLNIQFNVILLFMPRYSKWYPLSFPRVCKLRLCIWLFIMSLHGLSITCPLILSHQQYPKKNALHQALSTGFLSLPLHRFRCFPQHPAVTHKSRFIS